MPKPPASAAADKRAELKRTIGEVRRGRITVRGISSAESIRRLEARIQRIKAAGRVVP